ncbi:MAG: hypothetical protein KDK00_06130 [Rhodobacteraceae bacterium]|nr:hypothetical protein [Paracoccaceae bacterium]
MRRLAFACLMILAACARPLSEGEADLAGTLFGPAFDPAPVRVAPFAALSSLTERRPPRPRIACRERIWPAPEQTDGMVKTFTAAFVSFNRINIATELYAPDYLPDFPARMSLPAAMLIGHEMTHVWQWQNREITGYHPLKAAAEHRPGSDPYLLEIDGDVRFLDFPYEQQGAIVEEYVCCRALDPTGARTRRLHEMLAVAFPVSDLDRRMSRADIRLPWDGAETRGICS